MPNNNMNFGVDLLPISDKNYNLGSSDKKWNLYVNQINGNTPSLTDTTYTFSAGAETNQLNITPSGQNTQTVNIPGIEVIKLI